MKKMFLTLLIASSVMVGCGPATTNTTTEETKPAETTTETQPGETTPAETQPEETTPSETQPGETAPAETQPGENQPGAEGQTMPNNTTTDGNTLGDIFGAMTNTTTAEGGQTTQPGDTNPGGETTPGGNNLPGGDTTPGGNNLPGGDTNQGGQGDPSVEELLNALDQSEMGKYFKSSHDAANKRLVFTPINQEFVAALKTLDQGNPAGANGWNSIITGFKQLSNKLPASLSGYEIVVPDHKDPTKNLLKIRNGQVMENAYESLTGQANGNGNTNQGQSEDAKAASREFVEKFKSDTSLSDKFLIRANDAMRRFELTPKAGPYLEELTTIVQGSPNALPAWQAMGQRFKSMSSTLPEALKGYSIMVMNPKDSSRYILEAKDGQITLDALSDMHKNKQP